MGSYMSVVIGLGLLLLLTVCDWAQVEGETLREQVYTWLWLPYWRPSLQGPLNISLQPTQAFGGCLHLRLTNSA